LNLMQISQGIFSAGLLSDESPMSQGTQKEMNKAWVIHRNWNTAYELPAKHKYLIINLINLLYTDETPIYQGTQK
jgi:hypothetical protein